MQPRACWASVCFIGATIAAARAAASQDVNLAVRGIAVTAHFHIAPATDAKLCSTVPSCKFPTYSGTIEVHASADSTTRELKSLIIRINGTSVGQRELKPYIGRSGVHLEGLYVAQSGGYLPAPFREEVAGLSEPYLAVYRVMFETTACESGASRLQLIYDLEAATLHAGEECVQRSGV
jgi:hypothetical protein